ncbi:pirin family protein [Rhodanobacter sp. L36]|uniref:pirin family protein n=1 Tax=Rhodanobacter sp. L36 TaxID=1747221 RepID=UPI00131AC67A|nr:pirin family protein [Rhodanobacter sp. L36]
MQAQPILIKGQIHDLGDGFAARRMLPMAQVRHVGPLVFFDHFGPATFAAGNGMDVRPHPHIGLATISWLFEGQIRHRDSLGSLVDIRPGEVNWMTAGRGIVHSERTPPEPRRDGQSLHGVQIWVALPQADTEVAPEFHHHDREQLPRIRQDGVEAVLIAGDAYGAQSPVKIFAPMFLLEVQLKASTDWPMPQEHAERGVLVIEGALRWGDLDIAATQMAVQTGPTAPSLHAVVDSRLILFGGAPLDGERHLWWNFVAPSRERIEQAKADWQAQRFGTVPGDDQEFIPLPG